jgi:hypothetical protein
MWGSLFGRGKDDVTELSCAACGRTLLAGEWTQRVVDGAGEERLVCSLCAQANQAMTGDSAADPTEPVAATRPSAPRTDSDTFWKALKDKDAEIARLQSQVTQIEAARRELAARLVEFPADGEALPPVASQKAPLEVATPPEVSAEADEGAKTPAAGAGSEPAPEAPAGPEPRVAEPELSIAQSSLTLLQRGVDLLNVSTVPRKIAETNEHLGIPSVHVGLQDEALLATFLWSMGWYTYSVSMDGTGTIRLSDRGYQQRTDLQPNASVRSDGTVQLAPARITRAAAPAVSDKPQQPPKQPVSEQPPAIPAAPAPEIVSKSLMGQRTDDEGISWEQTKARDFDWDR